MNLVLDSIKLRADIANLEILITELNDAIDRNTDEEQWWRWCGFAHFFKTYPLSMQSLVIRPGVVMAPGGYIFQPIRKHNENVFRFD